MTMSDDSETVFSEDESYSCSDICCQDEKSEMEISIYADTHFSDSDVSERCVIKLKKEKPDDASQFSTAEEVIEGLNDDDCFLAGLDNFSNFQDFFEWSFNITWENWMINELDTDSALCFPQEIYEKLLVRGKAKYLCRECGNKWTSVISTLVFFYLKFTEERGAVYYYLYGQKCLYCPDEYVIPRWYEDEIERVISLLYVEVAERCYNMKTPLIRILRPRHGSSRGYHQRHLCEACKVDTCPSILL
ncbi:uncharacterized protein LOC136030343 [Artemia franciscana]